MSTAYLEEQIRLIRLAYWQYQLDRYTDVQLRSLLASIEQAETEIMARLGHWAGRPTPTGWSEAQAQVFLDELEGLSSGIRSALTGEVATISGRAGAMAYEYANAIVSWDGKIPNFNAVSLTADQVYQLAVQTPLGGRLLEDWVGRTLDSNLADAIRGELLTGMFKGESYPDLIARVAEGWDGTRHEITTLVRTYVQSANVGAMQSVYEANKDIVKGWRWVSAMELGGMGKKGGGTCIRCAVLDGNEYMWGDPAPEIPLHPNCRCVAVPITKTWKELGLNIDEMEAVYRPWTETSGVIGEGRPLPAEMLGFHQGAFGDLFAKKLNEAQQISVVGPGRFGLLQQGIVKWGDLVDPDTGQLRLLKKVGGKIVGLNS